MKSLRIATTQFSLQPTSKDDFWERVEFLCLQAHQQKARVILFPEYFTLSYLVSAAAGSFQQSLRAWPNIQEEFCSRFKNIAKRYSLFIIAGTVPVTEKRRTLNRCHIFTDKGQLLFQDKRFMTRFEDEEWGIGAGRTPIRVFDIDGWKVGVAICFDVEFPSYIRHLVNKNVDVIMVPSCTEDVQGYWRVRHCAEARAVETQSYVVTSAIVGGNPEHSDIANHYGRGIVLTPCDVGFPESGVLKEGTLNQEGLISADLDFDKLKGVRESGTVLNRKLISKKIFTRVF